MGQSRPPQKVKLIAGFIFNEIEQFRKAKGLLEKRFGPVDFESETMDFIHTDYYNEEMGLGLKRKFLSFERLVDLKDIYKIKLKTNSLERRLSNSGKRTVNVDPGYLDLSRLVLLSTKDYYHRIHLNGGIYAELTLFYKDKTFNPLPWTYPDYKTKAYIEIFNSIREVYKRGEAN